jgi:hypothetical protein|tara:strand:+ start:208 stop:420 length:213 start_codon:yes stop_codon:yes gene_type:complete
VSEPLDRQNQIDIIQLRGELKLLSQKLDVIKSNDLHHIQKSIDMISKVLWGVGFLILGQLVIAIRLAIWT